MYVCSRRAFLELLGPALLVEAAINQDLKLCDAAKQCDRGVTLWALSIIFRPKLLAKHESVTGWCRNLRADIVCLYP